MNPTHIHLLVTHLPIFGSMLGAIVLFMAIVKKSPVTSNAAYIVLLIAAVGAVVAYVTGEPAEDAVENITGVSKDLIEDHEESAMFTLISLVVVGLSSCVGLILSYKNSNIKRKLPVVVLIISIVSFLAAARTGYMGGRIRHTEIHNSTNQHYEYKK